MARTYDLKNVICSVGGVFLNGYGEDDALTFEWDSPIVATSKMADGGTVYSRNNDRGLTVTVTLMQTSRAHKDLYALIEAQHGDNAGIHPPVIASTPFSMVDPATGETVFSEDCVITDRPASNKGKTVGTVVYKFHLPNPKVGPAAANLI